MLELDPNYKFEESIKPKVEMIKELAKINNMTEEEVKDLENNKDDYIFKDPYGNEITWTDYNIVMDLL